MDFTLPGPVERDVPLGVHTTLAVGGPARWFARTHGTGELADWLRAAGEAGVPTFVLGGGSNVLVSDDGFDGLVLTVDDERITFDDRGEVTIARVGAGASWDALVASCVAVDLAGIECLSGIPGRVGAAPIQNIGAYGQEVCEVVDAVHLVDRRTGEVSRIVGGSCGFDYRWSHFKGPWKDRYVVTAVDFALKRGGAPALRYPELQREVGYREGQACPPLGVVRDTVVAIRRGKSMVHDRSDPNHRSAGSFFVNPILPVGELDAVRAAIAAAGHAPDSVPAYPAGEGKVKLSAAALIERAGFPKGFVYGAAGLSTRHTLALVNRGEARASDIVALAAHVRAGVRDAFGVVLSPEPIFVGFDREVDDLLG